MKIAVTGYKGRLGSEIVKHGVGINSDITYRDDLVSEIKKIQPDIVINCAAQTKVDLFDTSQRYLDFGAKLCVSGIYNLVCACREVESKLIHISTDYVFDGNTGAYTEKRRLDKTPINGYGVVKYGAEIVLSSIGTEMITNIIIRTTGLYSERKQDDFFDLVTSNLKEGKELKVTKELHGNQTYIPHLVEGLLYVCERPDILTKHGVLHIASTDIMSRYDFALMIANVFGYDPKLLIPVKNKDIEGWVAPRPKKAGLKVTLAKRLGVPLYSVLHGLKICKENLQ
jgi:dTDP-4-dehydrorhamnose reductase